MTVVFAVVVALGCIFGTIVDGSPSGDRVPPPNNTSMRPIKIPTGNKTLADIVQTGDVKILAGSARLVVCANNTVGRHKRRISCLRVYFERLVEVTDNGNGVVCAGRKRFLNLSKQNFIASSVRSGIVSRIPVKAFSYYTRFPGRSVLTATVKVFEGAGAVHSGKEITYVSKGDVMFQVTLSGWPFCKERNATGSAVRLDYSIKGSKSTPRLKKFLEDDSEELPPVSLPGFPVAPDKTPGQPTGPTGTTNPDTSGQKTGGAAGDSPTQSESNPGSSTSDTDSRAFGRPMPTGSAGGRPEPDTSSPGGEPVQHLDAASIQYWSDTNRRRNLNTIEYDFGMNSTFSLSSQVIADGQARKMAGGFPTLTERARKFVCRILLPKARRVSHTVVIYVANVRKQNAGNKNPEDFRHGSEASIHGPSMSEGATGNHVARTPSAGMANTSNSPQSSVPVSAVLFLSILNMLCSLQLI